VLFRSILSNRTAGSAGTIKTRYLHKDHLGSITVITDESGNEVESFSFDPWGKRRAMSLTQLQSILGNWSSLNNYQKGNLTIPALTLTSATTHKGFTGHNQLDGVNLIHMGGRVYDAEIGRFLSADPFVQDSTNLQALNRYSYVENNPLSYTDPSGYLKNPLKSVVKAFKKVVKGVFNVIKTAVQKIGRVLGDIHLLVRDFIAIVGCGGNPMCFVLANVRMSAAITYANGGTMRDVFEASAIAFVRSGIQVATGAVKPLGGQAGGGQVIFHLDSVAKAVGVDNAGSMAGDLVVSAGIERLRVAEGKAQAGGGGNQVDRNRAVIDSTAAAWEYYR